MLNQIIILIALTLSLSTWANSELVKSLSANSVQDTMDKLEKKLKEKGMTIFKRISHSEGARNVGQKLRDTELLIFGNPKIGTKLMNCNQISGIDLPLKMLSWKDLEGRVWLAYGDVTSLGRKYGIQKCAKTELEKMKKALNNFVQFSIK